jgi:hypothetical protein
MRTKAASPKQVRAKAIDDYNYRRLKRVLERRNDVWAWQFAAYWTFFKEINAKATLDMDKSAQKSRVDEIKAKYEKRGLRSDVLKEIARLVPLKVQFPD